MEKTTITWFPWQNVASNSKIINKPKTNGSVKLGSGVELKSSAGKKTQFLIVGTVEADPLNGKISDESPIGKTLLGRKVGDNVEIVTPADTTTYKIISIY